jgi:cyclomaltodextrin glucanotransferase
MRAREAHVTWWPAIFVAAGLAFIVAVGSDGKRGEPADAPVARWVGTDQPFADHAIYFLMTDRFANGDPGNDQRDQGGANRTFDRPLLGADGQPDIDAEGVGDNLGYLGGDFRGILDHAGYIREMGFSAVWITPIVDNPDEAFTGGEVPSRGSILTDRGKTGYHGYWGMNFHRVDEHLPSPGLGFRELTQALDEQGLTLVLDVVANHSSPAYTMPVAQPGFGQVYDAAGQLVADHQNLPPEQLDPVANPLHRMYATERDLAQLGDFDPASSLVMEHLVSAYTQWIDQGAGAFRLDTVGHMPPAFWREFTGRIRAHRPGFFMFAEVFDSDPAVLASYMREEGGGLSLLDFPLKDGLRQVFGREGRGYEALAAALFLEDSPYRNPYDLITFYDNHDIARMDATDAGFINAHNWLFTARGQPVVYYGSEVGFMRGRAEHSGNRNYFGAERIAAARGHPIREALAHIAKVRAAHVSLRRGMQVNVELAGDRAAFYRVYQDGATQEIALVLLNKGVTPAAFNVDAMLEPGRWVEATGDAVIEVADGGALAAEVPVNGVRVFLLSAPVQRPDLAAALTRQRAPHTNGG